MRIRRERIREERGATLVMVALGTVIFIGMVALAVDIGMLLAARTQSQAAADAGALGGAVELIISAGDPNKEALARAEAEAQAEQHKVLGKVTDVDPINDIDVILAENKVRVRVQNTAARGSAIQHIFGRILGNNETDVGTSAAAIAEPTGLANCPLPLALPDRWTETFNNDAWDGNPPDLYIPWDRTNPTHTTPNQCASNDVSGPAVGCQFTGFHPGDIGDPLEPLIEIKVQSGPPPDGDPDYVASPCVAQNSWRCWFQPEATNQGPGGGGANAIEPWILGCPDTDITVGVGDEIYAASGSGNMQSLVHQEFEQLVDDNQDVDWNSTLNCPVRTAVDPNRCVANTPRLRFMPVVRPDGVIGTGANLHATVVNMICVFVDKVADDIGSPHGSGAPGHYNVYVRLSHGCVGLPGPSVGLPQAVVLVE